MGERSERRVRIDELQGLGERSERRVRIDELEGLGIGVTLLAGVKNNVVVLDPLIGARRVATLARASNILPAIQHVLHAQVDLAARGVALRRPRNLDAVGERARRPVRPAATAVLPGAAERARDRKKSCQIKWRAEKVIVILLLTGCAD